MTDTIDDRLMKLQAKIRKPDKLEKAAFQERIEKTKKARCYGCKLLFHGATKHMWERKLYCQKCYNSQVFLKIKG